MSYALKSALVLVAVATAGMGMASAEAACATCRKPDRIVAKTQYKYSTVRQVRNVAQYRDVYRVHYFVKMTRVVSRAEFLRLKRSCKGACTLARK